MKIRFAAVASVTTAILLLSACGDGDVSSTTTSESSTTTSEAGSSTTLAKGEDVELVGDVHSGGLGAQTLNITAEEENGEATGEFRITDNVSRIDCADTDTDGVVILGGEATDGPDFAVGDLLALIIREGDPDSVALYANDSGAKSCTKLVESIPDNLLTDDSNFVDVEDGYDIETG